MRSIQNSAQQFNEKRCMTRIILSIISIVLCTAALSDSTYAWYLLSVTTETNTVTTGDYQISVTDTFDSIMSQEMTAIMSENAADFSSLTAGSHTLTITYPTTGITGFAVLEFKNGTTTKTYYTTATEVTYTVPDGTTLKVYAHWGVPGNFTDVGEAFTTGSTISF